jgi:hypothetical protein
MASSSKVKAVCFSGVKPQTKGCDVIHFDVDQIVVVGLGKLQIKGSSTKTIEYSR